MSQYIENEWREFETVAEDDRKILSRIRVPNGWMYILHFKNWDQDPSLSMVFVPYSPEMEG